MKKTIITVLALLAVVLTISCSQEVPSPNQSSSDKVDSQEVKVVVRDGLIYVEFSEDQNTILVHVDAQGTVTPYEYWTSQVNIIPAAGGNPEENFPYNYILGSNGLPILKEEVDAVYYLKDAYLSFGNISALSVTETNPIELKTSFKLFSTGSKRFFFAMPFDVTNTTREAEYRLQMAQLAENYGENTLYASIYYSDIQKVQKVKLEVTNTSSIKVGFHYERSSDYSLITPNYDVVLTFSGDENVTYYIQPDASAANSGELFFYDGKTTKISSLRFAELLNPNTNLMSIYAIEEGKLVGKGSVKPYYDGNKPTYTPKAITAHFTSDAGARFVLDSQNALSTGKYSIEAEPDLNDLTGYLINPGTIDLCVLTNTAPEYNTVKKEGNGYAIFAPKSEESCIESVTYSLDVFNKYTHMWLFKNGNAAPEFQYTDNCDTGFNVLPEKSRYANDFILDQYFIKDLLVNSNLTALSENLNLMKLTIETLIGGITNTGSLADGYVDTQEVYFILQY